MSIQINSYQIAFYLCVTTVILQALLGEWFYKFNIGKVYLTELVILFSWFIVLHKILFSLELFRFNWLAVFFLLSIFYIVLSVCLGREIYWIFRQGAMILYVSVSYISYSHVLKSGVNEVAILKSISIIGMSGGLLMLFHALSGHVIPGVPDYSSMLLFIFFVAWFLVSESSLINKIIFIVLAVLFVSLVSPHSLFAISLLGISMVYFYIFYPKSRIFIIVLSLLFIALIFILFEGFLDRNAMWRYLYWKEVFFDSWSRGWFLLGKGFGVQYIPNSSIYFDILLSQVSDINNADNVNYQLKTVPPHNSILLFLSYYGLVGVVLLINPLLMLARFGMNTDNRSKVFQILLISIMGMFLISLGNQFMSVPYAAVLYWLLFGYTLGYMKILRALK